MNNSKKPRPGVRNNSGKFHVPKGFPGAGKFTSKFLYETFYEPLLENQRQAEKAEKKAAKLAHDREIRQAARTRRASIMAKPDGTEVTKSELRDRLEGWGSTSTGPLREKVAYKWHGVFHVSGGAAVMQAALRYAGSDVLIKKMGNGADMQYEFLLTPYFGKYTPAQAEIAIPDHMAEMQAQLERTGATVTPLGAFWRNTR